MRKLLAIIAVCVASPALSQDTTTGLIHHWPMNESGASTSFTDSVGSNTGTAARNASLTYEASGPGTGINYSHHFNGTSDYIDLASDVTLAGQFTITCFAKDDADRIATYDVMVGVNLSGQYGMAFHPSDNFIRFNRVTSYVNYDLSPIDDSNWNHYAWVRVADNTYELYINGSLADDGAIASSGNYIVNAIGNGTPTLGNWLDGSIVDVRIYNTAKTEADIAAIYALKDSGGGGSPVPTIVQKLYGRN